MNRLKVFVHNLKHVIQICESSFTLSISAHFLMPLALKQSYLLLLKLATDQKNSTPCVQAVE